MKNAPRKMNKVFEEWMLHAAREHVNQGWSFGYFCGRHSIPQEYWNRWAIEIPELKEIRLAYNRRQQEKKKFKQGAQ